MNNHKHQAKKNVISSDLLFHYTQDMHTLKAILKSGYFWPCYNAQYGWAGGDFAIPATCFCDIPKHLIGDHVFYYGSYGLGMSKRWAKENKISPVYYLDVDSRIYNTIDNKLHEIKDGKVLDEIYYRLLYYAKKVCGLDYSFRNNEKEPEIDRQRCFYDEREWRYIPEINYQIHVKTGNYRGSKPQFDNSKMKEYGAKFKLNDIEYILIKTESERKDIIKFIEKTFHEDTSLLISKIESTEHMINNS